MLEAFRNAREELKRVEHLVYVSLKYTRTVDVLFNTIGRMVEFYEFVTEHMLKKLVEEGKLHELPDTPREQAHLVLEKFEDELIQDNMKLYLSLRKALRATPQKEQEFRRHVTATMIIDNQEFKLNIDTVTEFFQMQQALLEHIKQSLA